MNDKSPEVRRTKGADLQSIFESLGAALGNIGGSLFSLIPLVGVILIVIVVSRLLNRQAQRTTGLRFRNQLIITGMAFVGVLVIIVVLPVDPSLRGQLLTLVGIIISVTISLSSSTFLGNAMAGVMLKTVRNFRSGDFVKVGDYFGRVTERGLFHTEIQTPNRDLTTLPNLFLATTPVTVVRTSGTIVDATVSLGFDIPHGKVEKLLMEAAEAAELKEPFVQVLDLGDFSVTYRVAGLLEDTKRLLTFRSRLRVAMLDCLHRDGVEIVSPNFMNVRDFDSRHDFVPSPSANPAPVAADAPLEVVFDKAEEAQTLAGLQKDLSDQKKLLDEITAELKAAADDGSRQRWQSQVDGIKQRIDRLQVDIEESERREKADD